MSRPIALPLATRDTAALLAAVPAVGLLLLLSALTFSAQPQTDDYCTMGRLFATSGGNPLAETWYLYNAWTGRFSSSFLIASALAMIAALPGWAGGWGYGAILSLGIGSAVLGAYALGRSEGGSPGGSVLFGTLATSTVLVLMPSPLEGLFWLTGAAVYSAGLVVVMLLAPMVSSDLDRAEGRWRLSASTAGLVFLACGFNELLTMSLGLWLGLLVLARLRHSTWRSGTMLLAVALGGAIATAAAPGNFVRDGLSAAARHDATLAWEQASQSLALFVEHQASPDAPRWAWIFLGSLAAGWLGGATRHGRSWRESLPLAFALLTAVPLHAFAYPFLTGEPMPGRIVTQAYAMGLMGIALLGFRAGLGLASRQWVRHPGRGGPWLALVLAGTAGVCAWQWPTAVRVSEALGEPADLWRAEHADRRSRIEHAVAAGETTLLVPPIEAREELHLLLQGADIGTDPEGWINLCVAHASGLHRIQTAPVPPPP